MAVMAFQWPKILCPCRLYRHRLKKKVNFF